MRRFSDRQSLHTLAELNVTPLLDLAFVLLIIFIITTPLMDNKVDIVLPSSNATQNAVDSNAVQTIVLRRDETITLNNQPVDLIGLSSRTDSSARSAPGDRRCHPVAQGSTGAEVGGCDGCRAASEDQQGWCRDAA